MGEQISELEAAVAERFDRFVVSHAKEAMLWFVVPSKQVDPSSFVEYVLFETDVHNTQDEELDLDAESESFFMDVFTAPGMDTEPVFIDHDTDGRLEVGDDDGELGVILGRPELNWGHNQVRAVDLMIDHLVELEDAGHFVAAHRRYRDLTI